MGSDISASDYGLMGDEVMRVRVRVRVRVGVTCRVRVGSRVIGVRLGLGV
jgi:hypothetical protein